MIIRYYNSNIEKLSARGLPKDLDEAKDELIFRIEGLDIDNALVASYTQRVEDLENTKGIKNLVASLNADIDKVSAGGLVLKRDDGTCLVQTEDDMAFELAKIKKSQDAIEKLNAESDKASAERKKEIEEEIKKKKAERQESYKYASTLVTNVASATVDFTKGIISGDPDRMVDSILGALAGVFSLLTKGLALGVTAVQSARDKRKLGEKLDEVDIKKLEKVQSEVKEDKIYKSEPMNKNELEEVRYEMSETAFENVGEIVDWDSAFDYGYAKLKQIHGENYNQDIADATLEGLKEKYPDNPMVVIGALKYGRSKKREENSRYLNGIASLLPQINKSINESGFRAVWDIEMDAIEIKGNKGDMFSIYNVGNKMVLDSLRDTLYITTDKDKLISELVKHVK